MSDLTPPAASLLVRDIAEHDRHIADVERQLAAQESRIHALEIVNESLQLIATRIDALDPHTVRIQKLEDRLDFLTQRFDDVFVALRSRGIGISDFGTEARARGIPRTGGPIGTGLIDVPQAVSQTREEIRESHEMHYEGLAGQ